MPSLRRRLILAISFTLLLFFGLTLFALDTVYRGQMRRSTLELLDTQIIALISAAEPQADSVTVGRIADPRLMTPGSGLYAAIIGPNDAWRSPSSVGSLSDFGPALAAGEMRSVRVEDEEGARLAMRSRAVAWTGDDGHAKLFTFVVASDLAPMRKELARVRAQMFGWFAALAALLLLTLMMLLRRTLEPVRQLEQEIGEIEAGTRDGLSEGWPREFAGIAHGLNALLAAERERISRYRSTLGNLAHGLKTPLAVIQSTLEQSPDSAPWRAALGRELARIRSLTDHQLKRASTSGGVTLGQSSVEVRPVVAELRATLLRAHASKDFSIENATGSDAMFRGDRADLSELLGNLMDNAAKWCRERVRVSAEGRAPLRLVVEDDGPGIAAADRERVLERGARADEHVEGHGLGLDMVRDAVDAYRGALTIDDSQALGGARITIVFPAAR